MRRAGQSAVELLICSAILAAAFVPVYTAVQGSQRSAYLNELAILGRRRAYRALAYVRGHAYAEIAARANGEAPPDVPGLPPEGREIEVALPTSEEELAAEAAPGDMLTAYKARIDKMRLKVFFHELEPGLGRLAAVARWVDPTNGKPRYFVGFEMVEDPFRFQGRKP